MRAETGWAVRDAVPADERAIHGLICELEGRTFAYAPFCERLRAQMADGRHVCLVAEAGGAVAGVINLRIEPQLHHERPTAEILELVLDPGARCRGLGARLLAAARARAVAAGCEELEVHSNVVRTRAHRFYEREGMVKTHEHFTCAL